MLPSYRVRKQITEELSNLAEVTEQSDGGDPVCTGRLARSAVFCQACLRGLARARTLSLGAVWFGEEADICLWAISEMRLGTGLGMAGFSAAIPLGSGGKGVPCLL